MVSTAALALERRWTYAALRRASPDISRRLHEQRQLFDAACFKGTRRQLIDHGEAMVRGYRAAVRALEDAGEPDDAYTIGHDVVTGLKVAIGQQRAALSRIREIHGDKVIWVTPDEVARMLAGMESFKTIGAVKKLFPGAELLDRYEEEGNHDDDEIGEGEGDAGSKTAAGG